MVLSSSNPQTKRAVLQRAPQEAGKDSAADFPMGHDDRGRRTQHRWPRSFQQGRHIPVAPLRHGFLRRRERGSLLGHRGTLALANLRG